MVWDPFSAAPRLPSPQSLSKRTPQAQCLVRARVSANLTQAQLAERSGVSPHNLATWEVRSPVSAASWRKLREVLPDLPAEWAFTFPPLLEQYTGQRCKVPAGTTVEALEAERAKIATVVLTPDADPDGYYTS